MRAGALLPALLAGALLVACAPLALRDLPRASARQVPSPTPVLRPPADARSSGVVPAAGGPSENVAARSWVGSPARGERLFTVKGCAICHGTEAEGNVVGPALRATPLSPETVVIRVRAPIHPKMPPYGWRDLTDDEIADIYAFLRSASSR